MKGRREMQQIPTGPFDHYEGILFLLFEIEKSLESFGCKTCPDPQFMPITQVALLTEELRSSRRTLGSVRRHMW